MTPHTRPATRRAGFMMIEMLAALILLTAFALVASRLFTWAMRVTAEAPAAEGQILLFDGMVEQMRADAWSASSVRAVNERRLDLDGGGVRWTVSEDGSAVRTSNGDTRTWRDVGARVRFEAGEAGALVRVLDRHGNVSDRIPLASELELLRRATR